MKKGQTSLKGILVAIMVFGGIITATSLAAVELGETYNNPINDSYQSSYNTLSDTVNQINRIEGNLSSQIESSEGIVVETESVRIDKVIVQALKQTLETPKIVIDVFSEIAKVIGIPAWVVVMTVSIFTILVIFLIIAAIRGLASPP